MQRSASTLIDCDGSKRPVWTPPPPSPSGQLCWLPCRSTTRDVILVAAIVGNWMATLFTYSWIKYPQQQHKSRLVMEDQYLGILRGVISYVDRFVKRQPPVNRYRPQRGHATRSSEISVHVLTCSGDGHLFTYLPIT